MRSNSILHLFFYIHRFLFHLMCFSEFCGEKLMKTCNWVILSKHLCRWPLPVVHSAISYMYYINLDVRNRSLYADLLFRSCICNLVVSNQRMGVGMVRLHCPAHYEIVVKASNMVSEDWFQLFLNQRILLSLLHLIWKKNKTNPDSCFFSF